MKIKFKKLHKDAITPSYAKEGDGAIDLTSIGFEYDNVTNSHIHRTGIALEIPYGFVGLIFPRGSIANKTQILSNGVGVIDSGYRGEIKFVFKNVEDEKCHFHYKKGERIGQLIIIPHPQIELEEVKELSTTERGSGGFGSSGK